MLEIEATYEQRCMTAKTARTRHTNDSSIPC